MKLKIISTGSIGNCYLLEGRDETLILECGVKLPIIKRALGFDLSKVTGCLVSHRHLDHSKAMADLLAAGVDVWASKDTHEGMGTEKHHRSRFVEATEAFRVGSFKILPFDVKHDVPTLGFLINHPECGNLLFVTDTYYVPYTFKDLNNIMVEANFSREIIDRKVAEGASPQFLRNRVLRSHLSLEHCKTMLMANDLSRVNNIVLIHLSDSNSHAKDFESQVRELTQKNVTSAYNGLVMDLNKTPF